ncbi:MAG: glycosyl transferase family 1 [Crocinitomicaceae bacterium]
MTEEKHVLLIAYYWPPSGGAGVHRWLRFSNFFKENGCKLTVFCPEDAAWPEIDSALLEKVPDDVTVIRRKVFEPHKYLGNTAGTGFTEKSKPSLFKRFVTWVRGNMFIPDSRVFWIRPSVRYLSKHLKNHPEIKTIVSSGPPHSAHVIGLKLKKKFPKHRWVADFRDPWTQIDFYHNLNVGKRADKKQKALEKECLQKADEVVTISQNCASGLEEISSREVNVITNGYIFPEFDPKKVELDSRFTISHFGTMPLARNPEVMWKALQSILKETPSFAKHLRVNLIGVVDYNVIDSFKKYGLEQFVEVSPLVPHAKSIELQRKTQILLLSANNSGNVKGILTGKFFEYLGAKRPILAIGAADSDLARAVKHTQCGFLADFEDHDGTEAFLRESYQQFLNKNLYSTPVNTESFDSKNLTKDFIDLL